MQETYEITDLIYYDTCTSDTDVHLNINYPTDYELECTIVAPVDNYSGYTCALLGDNVGIVSDGGTRFYLKNSPYAYTIVRNAPFTTNEKIKFVVENGYANIYSNDVLKRTESATNDGFRIRTYATRYIIIKDIKVKAL